MCIGIPLQVRAMDEAGIYALCGDESREAHLDMRLVGPQPAGTWVLDFQGAARRVLDEDEAQQIRNALRALDVALTGDGDVDSRAFDALFADLVDREPQLPPHLRTAGAETR